MSSYWKVYQDFKPVVLTKTKTHNNNSTSTINKSNIHINKPNIEDDNEVHRIITYIRRPIQNPSIIMVKTIFKKGLYINIYITLLEDRAHGFLH
jgi:hypothetical protein